MCSRSAKPIVLKRTKAAGRDTVAAVRKCHTLPPRQLVTPNPVAALSATHLSSMRSSDTMAPCRSQLKGQPMHCVALLLAMQSPRGSRQWESVTSLSATETLTTRWGSPLIVRLVLGARSGQGLKLVLSLRGYGNSSTAFENKIIDRFFKVAIATASVGRFYTVVHAVKGLLWSSTLATGVCLLHGNLVFVFDKNRIVNNASWIQPPACAGRFCIEDFVSVCVERSSTLLLSLSAEHEPDRHIDNLASPVR